MWLNRCFFDDRDRGREEKKSYQRHEKIFFVCWEKQKSQKMAFLLLCDDKNF